MKDEDLKEFSDWIKFTIEMLVVDPDAIKIICEYDSQSKNIKIKISGHGDELARIIGRKGETIESLKRVGYVAARRCGAKHFEIRITDGRVKKDRAA